MNTFFQRTTIASLIISLLFTSCNNNSEKGLNEPIEKLIDGLISQMTIDEKLLLLSGDSTGFATHKIDRLGIPSVNITDGPLGVRFGKATSFPAGVAMAATWDTSLIYEMAVAMARETKAKNRDYLLGPCVCIQRFPFGGRNFETYSEDPYLASRLAVNWVKGAQSERVITSVKHFAMNDQELNRFFYNVIVDERTIREIHLPTFEAAVCEGNVWSVMAAHNLVNGKYCTENTHLLKEILKKDWNFQGFVISDWNAVHSTVDAAIAGLDLEMPQDIYFSRDSLSKALKEGKITKKIVNDKVRRLLRIFFYAGLFDDTGVLDTSSVNCNAHKQLTLKCAQEAIVLLKNQDSILPLNLSKIKKIAVIGPNANICRTNGGGSSFVQPFYSVSPLEGIRKITEGKAEITFALGDNFGSLEKTLVKTQYLLTPDKKEHGLLAEYFNNMELSGTPVLRKIIKTLDLKWPEDIPNARLDRTNISIRFKGYIIPDETTTCTLYTLSDDGVRVYLDDKMIINNWSDHGPIYDTCEVNFQKGKAKKLVIEYYQHAYDGTIQLGWNYEFSIRKPLIEEATDLAKSSDVAIIFVGLNNTLEGEGVDPGSMELPSKQKELIQSVAKVNPNTIVILNGGIPLSVHPWLSDVKGLIDMFYLGQETGNAIASVLFGGINPSGKLPFSFIKSPDQSPACKNYKKSGSEIKYDEGIFVGYRYLEKNKIHPEFPFGFGLSYTRFEYSNIKVKNIGIKTYEVSVDIKNTGEVTGDEIVQLYVNDPSCSVSRPVKELKGFSRVSLEPGEIKTIKMKLKERDFAFWDIVSNTWKVEPGDFNLFIGSNSNDIRLLQTINIK